MKPNYVTSDNFCIKINQFFVVNSIIKINFLAPDVSNTANSTIWQWNTTVNK